MTPTSDWPVVAPSDLREGDEIEITARAKVQRSDDDALKVLFADDTGGACWFNTEACAAMTIRRAPPAPEPVTLSEAMEALRNISEGVTPAIESRALVARYSAQTAPNTPGEAVGFRERLATAASDPPVTNTPRPGEPDSARTRDTRGRG